MPERHYLTLPQIRTERLPSWFKVKVETTEHYLKIRQLIRDLKLNTVCEDAKCPNIWECWNRGTATFMILGDICTRSCGFCAVKFGRPNELDMEEPARLAEAVATLNLSHVVITSVNRDELENGGAEIFAESIKKIRERFHDCTQDCTIEVLIPDFQGNKEALAIVLAARPEILSHNTETVPRLYPEVRPQAKYRRSLQVLTRSKRAGLVTKTGLMLGLGETDEEVLTVMSDLVEIGCDVLTLGQYLQPTAQHLPVKRFVSPDGFLKFKIEGERMGLSYVEAGPRVRSSYHAEGQARKLSHSPI